jgi:outer membrane protein insertion porin family
VRYSYQDVTLSAVEDPLAALEDKLEDVKLGNLSFAVVRNTRDDLFVPTRGGVASAELSVFSPVFLSDETFAKLFLRGAFTKSYSNDLAVTGALRVGLARPWGGTDRVPLSERYFAGGESTLRGFARDSVGPQAEGIPSGGEAFAVLNVDWMVPIRGAFFGVLFADVGNVWEDLASIDLGDVRSDAGLGLRIVTPIGPVRAEYAWKLDRKPEESPGQFYFSIGIPF